MIRARFAPSPTGYLHIGSARTFIFNWLYVRKHQGTMVLRIDDTDVDRNTEASLNSIYEGLNWLGLGWDEFYRQSERLDLHRKLAFDLLQRDRRTGISRRRWPIWKTSRTAKARGYAIRRCARFQTKRAKSERPPASRL